MTMIDCRQVAGYWVAIALSIILFNIGIAIASFFTTYTQQEWRIVGVSVLATGFFLLVVIPLLIRRNIRSRYREAFRSLPEAELRRKRCNGHCIAWMVSAVHFILGIAVTSFASDIRSKGWVVVGLVLLCIGIVAMVITAIHIYKSLREKTVMNQVPYENGHRKEKVLLQDPTKKFPANSTLTTTIGGKIDASVQSEEKKEVLYKERRWQSNPDIYGDLVAVSVRDQVLKCNPGLARTRRISSLDFSVMKVVELKTEQIHHLSTLLDTSIPGWKILGHKVAAKHRQYFSVNKYRQLLNDINDCQNSNENQRYSSIASNGNINNSSGNSRSTNPRSSGVVSIDNTISVESEGGIYLIDVGSSERESLLVREFSQPSVQTEPYYVPSNEVRLGCGVGLSPTIALFNLLKRHVPWLLVKDLCRILKGMGRHDIVTYIHKSHLAEVASNIHQLQIMYSQRSAENSQPR